MTSLKTLALCTAASIMAACATATPYAQATKPGGAGYTETKIQSDRYTVSFSGNSLTDRETVETYLLHRAAEVAVNNGYDYFTLDDENTETKTRHVSTGPAFGGAYGSPYYRGFACSYNYFHPSYGWRGFGPYSHFGARRSYRSNVFGGRLGGRGYDPFWDDFQLREITQYKARADIRLQRSKTENSFTAREVMENLSPKLIYPEVKK